MTTRLIQARTKLEFLLDEYLSNEKKVQEELPFILESIIFSNLLVPSLGSNTSNQGRTLQKPSNLNNIIQNSSRDSEAHFSKEIKEFVKVSDKWASRITALLLSRDPKTRFSAILILKQTSEQSIPILKPEMKKTQKVAIITLLSIYKLANQYTDLERDIIIPSVPKFCNSLLLLLKEDVQLIQYITDGLIWTARTYPTQMKSVSQKAITALLEFISGQRVSYSPEVVSLASKCIAVFCVESKDSQNSNSWNEVFNKTLRTIDVILNNIYDSAEQTLKTDPKSTFSVNLPDSTDYTNYISLQTNRCISFTELLIAMLSVKSKNLLTIPVHEIIHIVNKLSSISSGTKVL
ncbi:hypothetical protein BB560_004818 [Smittium megazygosporum]|uniref:Pre-rRNA-processing protein RIX1 n=1 Tax=Smittium megazygosporum TaxID=133381 RepID=A0A2T9Z867_9FUNG|nr:hypothetical protein BB560_004818 [Smittium megazygosporum]